MITKQVSLHHSITELGNIQVRQAIEYIKDGKGQGKNYGDPMAPADVLQLDGWDDRTKEIVAAITTEEAKAEFEAEKQTIKGISIEEQVTYDRVVETDGRIAVRRTTRIFDDGKEVSKKYHRSWIMPGDDFSRADAMSKALTKKLHTPKVITKYNNIVKEGRNDSNN